MQVFEALQQRRSIRKYTAEPVSSEALDVLMHAAMSGPSACNRVPWEFYIVTNPATLAALRECARYSHIEAPAAIVVCGSLSRALPAQLAPYWVQDCSAATMNILLAATELGLGTVWCGIHPQKLAEEKVAKVLQLPEKLIPLNIVFVGHPAEQQPARDQYNAEYVHVID